MKEEPLHKICLICGTQFDVPVYWGYRKYCSMKCSGIGRRGRTAWNKGIAWSEDIKKKVSETKKKMYANGEIIPWAKGKTKNDDIRLQKLSDDRMGENNPMFGKERSQELRERISKAEKGRPSPMKGKKHTEDTKIKMSKSQTGKKRPKRELSSPSKGKTIEELYGYAHAEDIRLKLRFARANQAYLKKDTSIEIKIKKGLEERGIKYTPQKPLYVCIPDFVINEHRIAIFCDGDYWHNLPGRREKDELANRYLFMHGWYPLRFWEHDINENIDKCIDEIVKNMTIHARFISDTSVILGRPYIDDNTWIGHSTVIDGANAQLKIGKNCSISSGANILTHDNAYYVATEGKIPKITASVTIGDDCFIGSNSVIIPKDKDITIGDHCVIGALTLVRHSTPPYTVWVGSPARMIRRINPDDFEKEI